MPKKRVFVSSTGRTGTQFFAEYLNLMIEQSVSLHEPGTPWISKPKKLLGQIRDYGPYHLFFGQASNRRSMYKLSRDFTAGDISEQAACENALNINDKVDTLYAKDAEVVVYSSGHIYGVMGLLDQLYDDCRFVFIVRDPRTWIGSALHKIEFSLYGPIEWFFHNISLQPNCFANDPYAAQWRKMSKFEKYCWYYNKINTLAFQQMADKPNFKVFRYEDVFLSKNKAKVFEELLSFATDFMGGRAKCHFDPTLIDKKVDSKQSAQTAREGWRSWTPEQAQMMQKHCGALMQAYGYGQEDAWQAKLNTSETTV